MQIDRRIGIEDNSAAIQYISSFISFYFQTFRTPLP